MQQVAIELGSLHAKQTLALQSQATELFFGGAAGPGKSHLMRVAAILWCAEIAGLQCYLFRRIREDLIKNHMEGPAGFRALLAPWVQARLCTIVEDEIRFWNGSRIFLCHCKDAKDVYKYQGAEIHLLLIDELTQWLEDMYRFIRSRVRAPGLKVPEKYAGLFPRIICAANPGNIGHTWVKATFIDGAEPYSLRRTSDDEGGMLRQFIPARLEDNPTMARDDPNYEKRLSGLGSKELVRAMREGDWDIVAGAFFDNLRRDRHMLKAFTPPKHWTRFRSMDWGSAKPFSVGWYAIVDEPIDAELTTGQIVRLPVNALIRYREWYGVRRKDDGSVKADEGIKLRIEELADGILEREYRAGETIDGQISRADPAMWSEDGGPSLAEKLMTHAPGADCRWKAAGDVVKPLRMQPADNTRIAGWQEVRGRLDGDEDAGPMLYVTDNCVDFWRTVPDLQHDRHKPEDLDTDGEDHAADELRYACMARPYSRVPKKRRPPDGPAPWSFDWVVKQDQEAKKRRTGLRG